MHRDVEHEKRRLKSGEHDNFPKGAKTTGHTFRKDKQLRSNEDMYPLRDDEILPGEILTEHVKTLPSKCCRGAYHMTKGQLANVYRVHGEGLACYGAAQGPESFWALDKDGKPTLATLPADPDFGWDMQNREEGFPCIALQSDGKCGHYEAGHPRSCMAFPHDQHALRSIPTCSYTFDEAGVRSGECDGCEAGLKE